MFNKGIILGGLGSSGLLSTAFLFLAGNAKNEKTRENFFNSVLDGRKIEIESLFKNRGGLFYAIPQGENGINGELKIVTNKDEKGKESDGFDSGCEFIKNVLGENGEIKYLKEKGRKILDEELKNEDWQKKTVKEVLKEGTGDRGCLLDKIMNSNNSEFRPFYLINVNQFSTIKGQSGLINFGRKENERIKLASWGIYQSRKKFNDRITKIRIIEGEDKDKKLTYDLYISTEWTKQLEDWENKSSKKIILSLAEFWPREGSEDNEQKGLTNLIWKTNDGKWKFARFDVGLAPAVKDFKSKVGYLEGESCKRESNRFDNILDKELCKIGSENVKNQKWQIWFPEILEGLEMTENNNGHTFKKGECTNLKECIKKTIENPNNQGDMVGVWGEVGILDGGGGGVRWRSF